MAVSRERCVGFEVDAFDRHTEFGIAPCEERVAEVIADDLASSQQGAAFPCSLTLADRA